jgi:hypothetical protein
MCDADWTDAANTPTGLAKAVRTIYTAVKHAEKEQPDAVQMMLVCDVMLLVVRMIAARRVDLEGKLVKRFAGSWSLKKHFQSFESVDLIIDDDGIFTSRKRTGSEPGDSIEPV